MIRQLLLFSLLFSLQGCFARVEDASLVLKDNGRLDGEIKLGKPISSSRANSGVPQTATETNAAPLSKEAQRKKEEEEQRQERKSAQALEDLRNCVSGNASGKDFEIMVRVFDQNPSQINRSISCIPGLSNLTKINVYESKGYLIDIVNLEMTISFPMDTNFTQIPDRIRLEMPSESEIEILSDSNAVYFETQIEENRIFVLEPRVNDEIRKNMVRRQKLVVCGNDKDCKRRDPHAVQSKIKLSMEKYRFGIGDILSFFSILFGSGIAITLGSRILAVRTEHSNKS